MSVQEEQLLEYFQQLPVAQQQALLDYAAFLCQRYAEEPEPALQHPMAPLDIPRPEQESVIKAVRRLSKTYPMLDSNFLFEKTSSFMTRHLMRGEDGDTLIDEMEVFFQQAYESYLSEHNED